MIVLQMKVRQREIPAAQKVLDLFHVKSAVSRPEEPDTAMYRIWVEDESKPGLVAALQLTVHSFELCSVSRGKAVFEGEQGGGIRAFRALDGPHGAPGMVRMFGIKKRRHHEFHPFLAPVTN